MLRYDLFHSLEENIHKLERDDIRFLGEEITSLFVEACMESTNIVITQFSPKDSSILSTESLLSIIKPKWRSIITILNIVIEKASSDIVIRTAASCKENCTEFLDALNTIPQKGHLNAPSRN